MRRLAMMTEPMRERVRKQTDAAKLQQILYNFLSNAIKFSPAGGQIELVASRQGEGMVRISVTDHGPGIAVEKQQVIFEKFRQIDGSHTRQYSGSGLGLSISRDLTRLLGGSIGLLFSGFRLLSVITGGYFGPRPRGARRRQRAARARGARRASRSCGRGVPGFTARRVRRVPVVEDGVPGLVEPLPKLDYLLP